MSTSACSRRMLAAGDHTLVEQCSCGSVHVTIGAVTLRLASAAIPTLAKTLTEAALALALCDARAAAAGTTEALS